MLRRAAIAVLAGSLLAAASASIAAATSPGPLTARAETPPLFDDEAGGDADADDPAIWVDPLVRDASFFVATAKNGGLRAYDFRGRELQSIPAPPPPAEDDAAGRFNNVDIAYGVRAGHRRVDLAVVTDRGRDQLRVYEIRPWARRLGLPPLVDRTAPDAPLVFSADQAEVNDQATAYGVTASVRGGAADVYVSRRSRTAVARLRLVPAPGGTFTYTTLGAVELPSTFTLPDGTDWSPCEDPGDLPQVEGMVADTERGVVFLGQEDIGIWRASLSLESPVLLQRVREFGVPGSYDPVEEECVLDEDADPGFGGEHLAADVEGLTIYETRGRGGYLLASSQGDDTFAVYERPGETFLGSFEIADGAFDGVQESDGAAVTNVAVGSGFGRGVLVVQDGDNTPEVLDGDGEARGNTNFKVVAWPDVATRLGLAIDPTGAGPRT